MASDVFISYRTEKADAMRVLLSSLEAGGLTVWRDVSGIRDGHSITQALRDALFSAKMLVVFCTDDYHLSQICLWELTTAWLAGLRYRDPFSRIAVWMAARDVRRARGALGPVSDAKWITPPDPGSDAWAGAVASIRSRAQAHGEPMGDPYAAQTDWFPYARQRSNRFIGRLGEMWRIADGLHRRERVGTTGARGPDIVQLAGMGGIGKTLLAVEYAHRFAAAYYGGIFWFESHDDPKASLRRVSDSLGLGRSQGVPSDKVAIQLREALGQRGSYLWVLDGLPPELSTDAVQALLAPTENGHTLITTRGRRWPALGMTQDVEPLDGDDSLTLLAGSDSSRRSSGEARQLVEELGGHPTPIADSIDS